MADRPSDKRWQRLVQNTRLNESVYAKAIAELRESASCAGVDFRFWPIIREVKVFKEKSVEHSNWWLPIQDLAKRFNRSPADVANDLSVVPGYELATILGRASQSPREVRKDSDEHAWQAGRSRSRGRRIVLFIDGTWNTPEELAGANRLSIPSEPPPVTNVIRLLRGVLTDDDSTTKPQVVGYFAGVGTEGSLSTRVVDGFSGRGLTNILLNAYRFVSHNLEWTTAGARIGRDEIFIFGFSRGAFAARALAGFLDTVGLLRKEALHLLPLIVTEYRKMLRTGGALNAAVSALIDENVHKEFPSIPVRFLGVWDTVGALGVPVAGLSRVTPDYQRFHDTQLTRNVSHAYQALAIHELRMAFRPVFWTRMAQRSQVVEQVWFSGAHSNVGGGYSAVGLSSLALDWMAYKAKAAGLEFDEAYIRGQSAKANGLESIAFSRNRGHSAKPWKGLVKQDRKLVRPVSLKQMDAYLRRSFNVEMDPQVRAGIKVHWSVPIRLSTKPEYAFDAKSLRALDYASQGLPVIPATETMLVP